MYGGAYGRFKEITSRTKVPADGQELLRRAVEMSGRKPSRSELIDFFLDVIERGGWIRAHEIQHLFRTTGLAPAGDTEIGFLREAMDNGRLSDVLFERDAKAAQARLSHKIGVLQKWQEVTAGGFVGALLGWVVIEGGAIAMSLGIVSILFAVLTVLLDIEHRRLRSGLEGTKK